MLYEASEGIHWFESVKECDNSYFVLFWELLFNLLFSPLQIDSHRETENRNREIYKDILNIKRWSG